MKKQFIINKIEGKKCECFKHFRSGGDLNRVTYMDTGKHKMVETDQAVCMSCGKEYSHKELTKKRKK